MKKSTYDAWSTVAVVALVLATFGAQRFSQWGYVFGSVAILSAVGSFVLYVRALLRKNACAVERQSLPEVDSQQVPDEHVRARVMELVTKRQEQEHEHEKRTIRLMQLQLFDLERADEWRPDVRYWHYVRRGLVPARVGVHRGIEMDPASIIANVVERLCSSTKEPRFEFILSKDGSFTIRPRAPEDFRRFDLEEGKEDSPQLLH